MTLIQPKPALKVVPLPVTTDLTHVALDAAAELARAYPHDGWADLVVHQAELRVALSIAGAYNARHPELRVRVLTETTLGRSDWKLKTGGVLVTSLWTNKPE